MDLLNPPRLDKQSVKKFFNRAAKSYDNAAILQEELLNRLLERLQYVRHQPETILDIGCGPGLQTIKIAKLSNGSIIAIDIHQPYLNQLRKTAEREKLQERIKIVIENLV